MKKKKHIEELIEMEKQAEALEQEEFEYEEEAKALYYSRYRYNTPEKDVSFDE